MVFGTLAELCNHHLHLVPRDSHHPKSDPDPISHHPAPPPQRRGLGSVPGVACGRLAPARGRGDVAVGGRCVACDRETSRPLPPWLPRATGRVCAGLLFTLHAADLLMPLPVTARGRGGAFLDISGAICPSFQTKDRQQMKNKTGCSTLLVPAAGLPPPDGSPPLGGAPGQQLRLSRADPGRGWPPTLLRRLGSAELTLMQLRPWAGTWGGVRQPPGAPPPWGDPSADPPCGCSARPPRPGPSCWPHEGRAPLARTPQGRPEPRSLYRPRTCWP